MRELLEQLTLWHWAAMYVLGVWLAISWMRSGWRYWAATMVAGIGVLLAFPLFGNWAFAVVILWVAATSISSFARSRPPEYDEAEELVRNIKALVKQNRHRALAAPLEPLAENVDRWFARLREVLRLVMSIEGTAFDDDYLKTLSRIEWWEQQRDAEEDQATRLRIQHTLDLLDRQRRAQEELARTGRRGKLQIYGTLAGMGEAYVQLQQILAASTIDGRRAEAVSDEVEEQVGRLTDLLAAIDAASDEVERLRHTPALTAALAPEAEVRQRSDSIDERR